MFVCLYDIEFIVFIEMSGKEEIRVKLLIIGESCVGKSSLLTQYVEEEFSLNHTTTIGVEYKQKSLKMEDGNSIRVQIWDTAGTTRYNTITPNYYRNVDGILLVFDISNKKSFEMVNFWINEVNEKTDVSKIDLLLVGNKIDLEENREVEKQKAAKVAEDIGILYVETSAKTLDATRVAFDQLVAKILKRKKILESTAEGFKLLPQDVQKRKKD